MIKYIDSIDNVEPRTLCGFFENWLNPPSQEMHLKVLQNSYAAILAMDEQTGHIVGFISAISDGVSAAHISWFEVLREYRNQGIGTELLNRMLDKVKHFYGVSLMCDEDMQPYYRRFGMLEGMGMNIRNFDKSVWGNHR